LLEETGSGTATGESRHAKCGKDDWDGDEDDSKPMPLAGSRGGLFHCLITRRRNDAPVAGKMQVL
jgi:hypothetical protein